MLIPWIYFLKEDDQLVVESLTRRWTVNGPGTYVSPPLHSVTRRKGVLLGPTDYIRVKNTLTGELSNQRGPKLYFLQAEEEVLLRMVAIPLKHNQYLRIVNKKTGEIRVEKGESLVFLEPTEELVEKIQDGINIDDDTAVLLRDTKNGNLELIIDKQVFFPSPNQEIVDIRNKIKLEDHETVVIKDGGGNFVFMRGSGPNRAFFLDPYSELVRLRWSSGINKSQRNLNITHFDSRPKFMWYEFDVRTRDNVELTIGITFFWQIVDVEKMIKTTDDTPGDVCSHARSMIIQGVSKVSLEEFLQNFNPTVYDAVMNKADDFYAIRGVDIHAVEVRSITCKDPDTQHILQEIIQETTNRLNQLMKQESENEIKIKQINGEIDVENMRGKLLELKREHSQLESQTAGEAEAQKVKFFLDGLGTDIPLEDRIAIFNTLRKKDILGKLSEGKAQLYFTPADVDLRIENIERR